MPSIIRWPRRVPLHCACTAPGPARASRRRRGRRNRPLRNFPGLESVGRGETVGPTAAAHSRADRADLDVGGQRWRWRAGGWEPLSVPVRVTQRYGNGGLRLVGPVLTTVEPDARSHCRTPAVVRAPAHPRMTRSSTIRRCPASGRGPAIANAGPVDALTPRVAGRGDAGANGACRARIPCMPERCREVERRGPSGG